MSDLIAIVCQLFHEVDDEHRSVTPDQNVAEDFDSLTLVEVSMALDETFKLDGDHWDRFWEEKFAVLDAPQVDMIAVRVTPRMIAEYMQEVLDQSKGASISRVA